MNLTWGKLIIEQSNRLKNVLLIINAKSILGIHLMSVELYLLVSLIAIRV